jgi:SnoaL-like domain
MFLSRASECTKLVDMDLAVLEEIRQLKYRYLRCVDQKLWDEMADVFTEAATVDYGTHVYGKPLKLAGRDQIIAFFRAKLGPEIITVHAAGQPEITVDGDKASGTWRFEDTVIATEHRVAIAGAAFYQDRYERGPDGAWRIAHTGYVRIYEAMMSLDDLPSFKFLAGLPTGKSDADAAVR